MSVHPGPLYPQPIWCELCQLTCVKCPPPDASSLLCHDS